MVTSAAADPLGLETDGLLVRFGATVAVDHVDLAIHPGEIVALVGPSGCGKSTLLRALAGLQRTDGGWVRWDGTDVTRTAPDRRGFGLMFQDHALFPHRTVGQNVAFGLRMQGVEPAARGRRVAEVLDLVGLGGFADRRVDSLSGGEAQRVALARALAPSPRLLMLDEPLGSLDRLLRDRLAADLRQVLTGLGLAAVHVTHDQEEAYAVADRLVVMRSGRVVRDGPAGEVWRHPGSEEVARFLGHENILAPGAAAALGLVRPAGPVVVREAAISVGPPPAADPRSAPRASGLPVRSAQVVGVRFRGGTSRVTLLVEGTGGGVELVVHLAAPPTVGDRVGVAIEPGDVDVLDRPS